MLTDAIPDTATRDTAATYPAGRHPAPHLTYSLPSSHEYSRQQTTHPREDAIVWHMTHSPSGPGQRPSAGFRLRRPIRRAWLVVHVIVSVGWLGLTLCLLTLAIAGAGSEAPATDEMAYRAMRTFTDWLLAPLALLTALSGVVLSLGTHWGLARHWWVLIKSVLTLVLITASLLALRGEVAHAAEQVAAGAQVDSRGLMMGPSVSLTSYVFLTAISVLKPWGLTRYGQRKRDAKLAARRKRSVTTDQAA